MSVPGGSEECPSPAVAPGDAPGVWLAVWSRNGKELPSANTLRINRLFSHPHTVCVEEGPEDTFPAYSLLCLLALKGLAGGARAV